MATPFGETARFWLGVSKLLWNAATSKVYCYLYIYIQRICVRACWSYNKICVMFFFNGICQTSKHEQMNERNQRPNLWMKNANFENLFKRMLFNTTMEILFARCPLHIRDHIVLIFYNYFPLQFNNPTWYIYVSLVIFI